MFEWEIETTETFDDWIDGIKDTQVSKRINTHVLRLAIGNIGDHKKIKGFAKLFEKRLDFGPGYRLYYTIVGNKLIVLLIGGTKRTQTKDIIAAEKLRIEYMITRGNK